MTLKQLIKYDNAPALEATWVDENDVVVKCRAYGNAQMQELRADLGADAAEHEALIAEIEATYVPPEPAPLADRQAAAWERIKVERDKQKCSGVKVGEQWFHSDNSSRIQQLALVMMGNSLPVGLLWKTLTLQSLPVFVEMTPTLAQSIFQATVASDAVIFDTAEKHRVKMEASTTPEDYDFSNGWPISVMDNL